MKRLCLARSVRVFGRAALDLGATGALGGAVAEAMAAVTPGAAFSLPVIEAADFSLSGSLTEIEDVADMAGLDSFGAGAGGGFLFRGFLRSFYGEGRNRRFRWNGRRFGRRRLFFFGGSRGRGFLCRQLGGKGRWRYRWLRG